MDLHVDQAGRDVEAGDINHVRGLGGGDIGRDRRDSVSADGYIHRRVDAVGRVNHVAAFKQNIVSGHVHPFRFDSSQSARISNRADRAQGSLSRLDHV